MVMEKQVMLNDKEQLEAAEASITILKELLSEKDEAIAEYQKKLANALAEVAAEKAQERANATQLYKTLYDDNQRMVGELKKATDKIHHLKKMTGSDKKVMKARRVEVEQESAESLLQELEQANQSLINERDIAEARAGEALEEIILNRERIKNLEDELLKLKEEVGNAEGRYGLDEKEHSELVDATQRYETPYEENQKMIAQLEEAADKIHHLETTGGDKKTMKAAQDQHDYVLEEWKRVEDELESAKSKLRILELEVESLTNERNIAEARAGEALNEVVLNQERIKDLENEKKAVEDELLFVKHGTINREEEMQLLQEAHIKLQEEFRNVELRRELDEKERVELQWAAKSSIASLMQLATEKNEVIAEYHNELTDVQAEVAAEKAREQADRTQLHKTQHEDNQKIIAQLKEAADKIHQLVTTGFNEKAKEAAPDRERVLDEVRNVDVELECAKSLLQELEKGNQSLTNERDSAEARAGAALEEIALNQERIANLEKDKKAVEDELEKRNEEVRNAEDQLANLEKDRKAIEDELQKLKEDVRDSQDRRGLDEKEDSEQVDGTQRYETLHEENQRMIAQLKEATDKIRYLETTGSDEKAMKAAQDRHDCVLQELKRVEVELESTKSLLQELEKGNQFLTNERDSAEARATVTLNEIALNQKRIKDLENEKKTIEDELQKLKEEVRNTDDRHRLDEKEHSELVQATEASITILKQQLIEKEEVIAEYENELTDVQAEVAAEKAQEQADRTHLHKTLYEDNQRLIAQLKKATGKIQHLKKTTGSGPQLYKTLYEDNQRMIAQLKETAEKIHELKKTTGSDKKAVKVRRVEVEQESAKSSLQELEQAYQSLANERDIAEARAGERISTLEKEKKVVEDELLLVKREIVEREEELQLLREANMKLKEEFRNAERHHAVEIASAKNVMRSNESVSTRQHDEQLAVSDPDQPVNEHRPLVARTAPVVHPLPAEVRETWNLMFSSRFEDEEDAEDVSDQPACASAANNVCPTARSQRTSPNKSQSSLRTKLGHERRLDEQIQSTTHSANVPYQTHSRVQAASAIAEETSRRCPKPAGWLEEGHPFEDAGLLPTAVRFCMEKAMLHAVQCLGELHAIVQDEPKPVRGDISLGIFITQWELNQILDDLFGDPATPASAAATNLHLHNPEYETLPLETLLSVSWFLPLDQFTRLRLMVAEISRKRLSEAKLAILNAALHRHYVLRPFPGVRMQRLMVRIVRALVLGSDKEKKESNQDEDHPDNSKDSLLVVELLHALHIRIPPSQRDAETSIAAFMQLNPFELARCYELTSVVAIQRVLFFRFFIELLVAQMASLTSGTNVWWPRSTGKPRRALERRSSENVPEDPAPLRSKAKRKTKPRRTHTDESKEPEGPVSPPDYENTDSGSASGSSGATHGSLASPHQEPKVPPDIVGVPDERSTFTRLNDALTAALTSLVRVHPWLVEDQDASHVPRSSAAVAMRASFLAAEAFQQSIALLSTSSAPVTASILAKMEDFTSLISNLTSHGTKEIVEEPHDPPPSYELDEPLPQPSKPSPRPVQRANSGSFPPPYVSTKPAYWTFEPEIPAPAPVSIPKSVPKAQASPGVGDYDVRRSDKLTFPQHAGHSFAKSGLTTVDETTEKAASPVRRQSMSSTCAVKGSESASSLDLPTYTHWASATVGSAHDIGDDEAEEDTIDMKVRDALRLQQSFVLDDLVQNLLHRGKPVASSRSLPVLSRAHPVDWPQTNEETKRTSASRVVSRVRTIATARALSSREPEPQPKERTRARSPKRVAPPPYAPEEPKVSPVKQPPRDYEPPADDGHLQWATRVSEFYKAKLKAATVPVAEE